MRHTIACMKGHANANGGIIPPLLDFGPTISATQNELSKSYLSVLLLELIILCPPFSILVYLVKSSFNFLDHSEMKI